MIKFLSAGFAALMLGACATTPEPLLGTYNDISPRAATAPGAGSATVRWGGEIVETVPGAAETCIFALSHPLDSRARPRTEATSMGRFVACRPGFYDPEVFSKGREITVTGNLDGVLTRKVGEYDYPYPRVAADVIYLWPVQRARYHPYRSPFYDPFWGPRFWNPFWYPNPRVIIVPVHDNPSPDDD